MLLNSPSVVHAHACFHTHMHPCTQTQRVGSPRDRVGGATAKGGAGEEKKKEAKGWAKRKTEGERRRGKWSTVSAGGAELPGNVTMSSPWEHRARRLFWTNRQLSRQ